MKKTKGMLVASAAASLILGGAVLARAAEQKTGGDMVHCAGINACKGQGECSGAGHGCAGKNACKGQGWVKATEKECTAKGGNVVKG
jgi:uncharacterized membrane protein